MNELKLYLKEKTIEEQEKFASSCGTSIGYIRKIISSNGKLSFGPKVARKIETNSFGTISRKSLRPKDWNEIWPELIEK